MIIPGTVVWHAGRQGRPPLLAEHYPAHYGGYGDFTVPDAPSTVAFYTWSDIEGFGLPEIVRDLDEKVEFLMGCKVACASCYAKQKVDTAVAPAPCPTGAATDDSAPTHTATMTPLMNNDAATAIRNFCAAFARRRFMTAPEFSAPASWHAFRDQYEQDLAGQLHPIRTQWFADMVRRATAADLDALDALRTEEGADGFLGANPGVPGQAAKPDGFQVCMIRCIQQNLLEKAYEIWDGDNRQWDPVLKRHVHAASPAIPTWFRAHGWNLPEDWAPNGEDYVGAPPPPLTSVSCAAGGGS